MKIWWIYCSHTMVRKWHHSVSILYCRSNMQFASSEYSNEIAGRYRWSIFCNHFTTMGPYLLENLVSGFRALFSNSSVRWLSEQFLLLLNPVFVSLPDARARMFEPGIVTFSTNSLSNWTKSPKYFRTHIPFSSRPFRHSFWLYAFR